MSHLGFILYLSLVIVILCSPVIAFLLYRGWRLGHLVRSLAQVAVAIPVLAAFAYVLMRYTP